MGTQQAPKDPRAAAKLVSPYPDLVIVYKEPSFEQKNTIMSDEEEYEYEYDDDDDNMEEDNPFEYTDEEDEQDDAQVALENAYYNAKGLRETSATEAAKAFEQVIEQEKSDGGYGPLSFKAMKQLVKPHLRLQNPDETRKHYSRLLDCIATGKNISPNAVEKGINGMLERVASRYQQNNKNISQATAASGGLPLAVYDETIQVFHPLARTSDSGSKQTSSTDSCSTKCTKLPNPKPSSRTCSQSNNSNKRPALQLPTTAARRPDSAVPVATQSQAPSRNLFQKGMSVRGGIPHPRTLALMQELGGKMHWRPANTKPPARPFVKPSSPTTKPVIPDDFAV